MEREMRASKSREQRKRSFWSKVELTVPTGFHEAVRVAAAARFMMPGEYARWVLLEALDHDGVSVSDFAKEAA
jgi:hypothetical protein